MTHGNIQTGRTGGPSLWAYSAAWDDYDGAPDAAEEQSFIGHGRTRKAAISELISLTTEFDEVDPRLSEYADYLRDKAEAEAEDYHDARREDVMMRAAR